MMRSPVKSPNAPCRQIAMLAVPRADSIDAYVQEHGIPSERHLEALQVLLDHRAQRQVVTLVVASGCAPGLVPQSLSGTRCCAAPVLAGSPHEPATKELAERS